MNKQPIIPKRDEVKRVFFQAGTYVFNQMVDDVSSQDCQLTLEGHYLRIVKKDQTCLVPLTNVRSIYLV